jgi:hypothetical protein
MSPQIFDPMDAFLEGIEGEPIESSLQNPSVDRFCQTV